MFLRWSCLYLQYVCNSTQKLWFSMVSVQQRKKTKVPTPLDAKYFNQNYFDPILLCSVCLSGTYSGAKKYLVSHQLCKFSHLKRWERPVIFIIGIPQLWETNNNKKSRKSHCSIFKEFICKLWWKISIWSPTNKQDCWLSQTCNFFFKRLLCPPLVTCINGICLN